jgi:DNA-binding beta-propeller fold protein YncE
LQWIARSSPANCGTWGRGAIVPFSTVTNTPGQPVRVGRAAAIAITPDGKTVYVSTTGGTVVPVSTATNQPGRPIRVPYGMPGGAVITP